MGTALARQAAGDSLLYPLRESLRETRSIAAQRSRRRVFYVVYNDPPMTTGPGTFIDQLLDIAGADNVFRDATSQWPTVSLEEVVKRDPDIVVLPVGEMSAQVGERLRSTAGWRDLRAVKNGCIAHGRCRPGEPPRHQRRRRRAATRGAAARRDLSRPMITTASIVRRYLLLTLLLGLTAMLAVRVGAVGLSLRDVLAAVRGTADTATHTIVVGLRIPRVVLAALCGAALAISGATYQALLRNTLAEPYILGVSSGAALGAVAATVLGLDRLSAWIIPAFAFAGALAAIVLVLRVALVAGGCSTGARCCSPAWSSAPSAMPRCCSSSPSPTPSRSGRRCSG